MNYPFLGLQPTTKTQPKRPRPISKKTFFFCLGSFLYVIVQLVEVVDHWTNINDEEDDEYDKLFTEHTSPLATLAAFCYVIMSALTVKLLRSTVSRNNHNKSQLEQTLERNLGVNAEYAFEICFGFGAILEFLGEELKLHQVMRNARKQLRLSNMCSAIALHLYVLSSMALLRIKTEGAMEKVGSLFLIVGSSLELSLFYIEYMLMTKVSNGVLVSGNLGAALLWLINAIVDVLAERYYYEDSDSDDDDDSDDKEGKDSKEPLLLYERLRHGVKMQMHKRHAPLRVV
jgi:hypothetical protein